MKNRCVAWEKKIRTNKGITINHFWLTLKDGRIIDPTASQFNGMGYDDMPDVFLGKKPRYYIPKKKKK